MVKHIDINNAYKRANLRKVLLTVPVNAKYAIWTLDIHVYINESMTVYTQDLWAAFGMFIFHSDQYLPG